MRGGTASPRRSSPTAAQEAVEPGCHDDETRFEQGRASGIRLGILSRPLLAFVLGVLVCLNSVWAAAALAVLTVFWGLRPARDYGLGYAVGFAEGVEREFSPSLAAVVAAGHLIVARGLAASALLWAARTAAA